MYMSVTEAAKKWGVTRKSVLMWCNGKKIECEKVGSTWVIPRDQPSPQKWGKLVKNYRSFRHEINLPLKE